MVTKREFSKVIHVSFDRAFSIKKHQMDTRGEKEKEGKKTRQWKLQKR